MTKDNEIFDLWSAKAIDYATVAILVDSTDAGPLDDDEQAAYEAGVILGLTYVVHSAGEVGADEEIRSYIRKLFAAEGGD